MLMPFTVAFTSIGPFCIILFEITYRKTVEASVHEAPAFILPLRDLPQSRVVHSSWRASLRASAFMALVSDSAGAVRCRLGQLEL